MLALSLLLGCAVELREEVWLSVLPSTANRPALLTRVGEMASALGSAREGGNAVASVAVGVPDVGFRREGVLGR